jgi:hypothetical protein
MNRLVLTLAVLAATLAGCTLMTSFDPEGQPCDPTATSPDKQCLSGYHCQANQCVKGAASVDGGS